MAIKGLQNQISRLPVLGQIRKGDKTGNRPIDLPYFRIIADDSISARFHELFGKQPEEFAGFFYGSEPLEAWMQEWGSGSLFKRCDGERVRLKLEGDKLVKTDTPCTFPLCNCKSNGILRIKIPKISSVGIFEMPTQSKHDIVNIDSFIRGLSDMISQILPDGEIFWYINLEDVPILFRKKKEKISKPVGGKRIRSDSYLVRPEVHPLFVEKLNERIERGKNFINEHIYKVPSKSRLIAGKE